ncbi:MAG: 2-C-methyl-D-erythritol 4-phosphate cytidylyltransferase [Pseudomonadota bacterium]
MSLWCVVPAAGEGRRMKSSTPKQYLPLAGSSVIETTLTTLLKVQDLQGIVVVLDPDDAYWQQTRFHDHPLIHRAPGGSERAHSVLNGLDALRDLATGDDWVMVHDAARPCVRIEDIIRLEWACEQNPHGAILGMQVRDTMKVADRQQAIQSTAPRENLWHAFTPQMFPLGLLKQALEAALERGEAITDEASAMERAGFHPQLVQGESDNLKITNPSDLALADFYLTRRGERECE